MCPQLVHVRGIEAVHKEAMRLNLGIGKAAWIVLDVQLLEGHFEGRNVLHRISMCSNHYYWCIGCPCLKQIAIVLSSNAGTLDIN